MGAQDQAVGKGLGDAPGSGLRKSLSEAAQFWEPQRLAYNLALAAVFAAWVLATWPHFRPAFALIPVLQLGVLALLANVCYCAAYLVDIPIRLSNWSAMHGKFWQRGRWGLWLLGTVLAIVFENYWIADEIYPYV